jgi:hypothetical protein
MRRRPLLALLTTLAAAPAAGQSPVPSLFPQPFVVEHRVRETQPDGSVFETETVRSTYAGSWVVSERPDRSRVIVDLARREITEVRPAAGTYWVLSFSQMTDLKARLARAEQRGPARHAASSTAGAAAGIRVEEVADTATPSAGTRLLAVPSGARKKLRASAGGRVVDVWVDPSVRLSAAAQDALDAFARAVSGPADAAAPASADLVAAARRKAGGAFVVRSVRASGGGGEIEEVVEKLAPATSVPRALLVPEEGLRRVPSPLEAVVSFAEEEAAHRAPVPTR